MEDAFAPARSVYEKNTQIAARRVHEMIADGVESGEFRPADGPRGDPGGAPVVDLLQ